MSTKPRFLPYGPQSRVRSHPHNMPSTPDLVAEFLKENPGLTPPGNAIDFLSDDGGKTYNRCHCMYSFSYFACVLTLPCPDDIVWSNFEIGDLDFWRGEAYSKFFDYLDSKGGFYYEVCIPHIQYCSAKSHSNAALGRRTRAQYWRSPTRSKRANPLFQ
jgi:hypothetical protein